MTNENQEIKSPINARDEQWWDMQVKDFEARQTMVKAAVDMIGAASRDEAEKGAMYGVFCEVSDSLKVIARSLEDLAGAYVRKTVIEPPDGEGHLEHVRREPEWPQIVILPSDARVTPEGVDALAKLLRGR